LSRRRAEDGQAAVEAALAVPLVAFVALALLQGALVVRDQLLVIHAAREAAREAAVSADPREVETVARGATGLYPGRLRVTMGRRGGPGSRVRVDLTYQSVTEVPLVGRLVGDPTLHSGATMRVER